MIFLALALALVLAPVSAGAGAPVKGGSPKAKVKYCRSSAKASSGRLSFTAEMSSPDRSHEMRMRFTVLQRQSGSPWRDVTPAALAQWRKKGPGYDKLRSKQLVRNLSQSSHYRVRVDFQWYSDGQLAGDAVRYTSVCRQKGSSSKPDLVAQSITTEATNETGSLLYVFKVKNVGKLAAGSFIMKMMAGDLFIGQRQVDGLAPGGTELFVEAAARCAGGSVTGIADPDNSVDERVETNNTATAKCPPLL